LKGWGVQAHLIEGNVVDGRGIEHGVVEAGGRRAADVADVVGLADKFVTVLEEEKAEEEKGDHSRIVRLPAVSASRSLRRRVSSRSIATHSWQSSDLPYSIQ